MSHRRRASRLVVGVPALLLACAPVSADVVIGNWEGTPDGWIDWGTQATIDTTGTKYAYSTTGATLGGSSIKLTQAGFNQNLAIKLQHNSLYPAFFANKEFAIDLTLPANTTVTSGFDEIWSLTINAEGYGFQNQPPVPKLFRGFPNGKLQTTLTWDYSALVDGDTGNGEIAPTAGWIEFILATNSSDTNNPFYFDNARVRSPSLRVDLDGGGEGTGHPTRFDFTSWSTLPTSGQNGNGPQNGYPTPSATNSFSTAMVPSGSVQTTLTSVDVGGTGAPEYLPGAVLNARDMMGAGGRALDDGGGYTPSKDNLYRDFAVAETATATNGTNHRMEVKFEGLEPNTPYKVKFYAYDNSNPQGVFVFTDVTGQPLIFMPSADATGTGGVFTPGDGSAGTQYAPDGQYIDGTASPTFPGGDDFRAIELFATSDGTGKLIFAETTVTGLSGITQILPVLNGFEIAEDQRVWQGGTGTSWNTASNWALGQMPGAKGQVANFGNTAGPITIDSPTTVGRLNFSGAGTTIGGGSTLTLDDNSINSTLSSAVTGRTEINLTGTSGNQTITAPLLLKKDTQVWVAGAGTTLTASNLQPSQVVLTKVGAGAMAVNNVRTNGLRVFGGAVAVLPNGGSSGVSVVNSLAIDPSAKLDLTDNDLLVDYAGASPEAQIRQWVRDGRTSGGATGIVSTPGAPADDVVLAVADNAEWGKTAYGSFNIDSSTIVGKYTYFGDSNLDGAVTGDDYLAVDSNLGTGNSWIEGDFNMDNAVTGDDYLAIDTNLGKGTPNPLAYAELKAEMIAQHVAMFGEEYLVKLADVEANGITVVPEPGALGLAAITAASLLGRRRRLH